MNTGGVIIAVIILVFWLMLMFFMGFIWWRIFKKTGYHGALGILMLVPLANIVMMTILAFGEWPIYSSLKDGEIKPPKSLPTPLIAVIAAVAMLPIFALLAAIAIPNFIQARLVASEHAAEATVRTISRAIESYAVVNNGVYPSDEYELRISIPPYLTNSYNNETIQGYTYSLNLNPDGYEVIATPAQCRNTGIRIFKVKTKGEISEEKCR